MGQGEFFSPLCRLRPVPGAPEELSSRLFYLLRAAVGQSAPFPNAVSPAGPWVPAAVAPARPPLSSRLPQKPKAPCGAGSLLRRPPPRGIAAGRGRENDTGKGLWRGCGICSAARLSLPAERRCCGERERDSGGGGVGRRPPGAGAAPAEEPELPEPPGGSPHPCAIAPTPGRRDTPRRRLSSPSSSSFSSSPPHPTPPLQSQTPNKRGGGRQDAPLGGEVGAAAGRLMLPQFAIAGHGSEPGGGRRGAEAGGQGAEEQQPPPPGRPRGPRPSSPPMPGRRRRGAPGARSCLLWLFVLLKVSAGGGVRVPCVASPPHPIAGTEPPPRRLCVPRRDLRRRQALSPGSPRFVLPRAGLGAGRLFWGGGGARSARRAARSAVPRAETRPPLPRPRRKRRSRPPPKLPGGGCRVWGGGLPSAVLQHPPARPRRWLRGKAPGKGLSPPPAERTAVEAELTKGRAADRVGFAVAESNAAF